MTTTQTDDLANLPHPAGATEVYDWDDVEFGDPCRYFRGSERIIERDSNEVFRVLINGIQRPGRVHRVILVSDGHTEAIGDIPPTLVRQLGCALVAAADEAETMNCQAPHDLVT